MAKLTGNPEACFTIDRGYHGEEAIEISWLVRCLLAILPGIHIDRLLHYPFKSLLTSLHYFNRFS